MIRRVIQRSLLAILVVIASSISAPAQTVNATASLGFALVIGNGEYPGGTLHTAVGDAIEVGNVLEQAGYRVLAKTNVGLTDMNKALQELLQIANEKVPLVIYYAGHGVQINGVNYLVPVDANFENPNDIPRGALSVDSIFDGLRHFENTSKIVILDACRTNPFGTASPTQWLPGLAAPTNAPKNSFIAFSTDPGSIAADSIGTHSPYTRALLRFLRKPGLQVEQLFKSVREDVISNTDGMQTPWENTSLTKSFYFRSPIRITGRLLDVDDDAVVLLNGQEVISWNVDRSSPISMQLREGTNLVEIKVYNQRSYTGGLPGFGGHFPEGWRYSFVLQTIDGKTLIDLSGREDRPTDNGPHHGKLFTVAAFQILVDEYTNALTIVNPNYQAWAH